MSTQNITKIRQEILGQIKEWAKTNRKDNFDLQREDDDEQNGDWSFPRAEGYNQALHDLLNHLENKCPDYPTESHTIDPELKRCVHCGTEKEPIPELPEELSWEGKRLSEGAKEQIRDDALNQIIRYLYAKRQRKEAARCDFQSQSPP